MTHILNMGMSGHKKNWCFLFATEIAVFLYLWGKNRNWYPMQLVMKYDFDLLLSTIYCCCFCPKARPQDGRLIVLQNYFGYDVLSTLRRISIRLFIWSIWVSMTVCQSATVCLYLWSSSLAYRSNMPTMSILFIGSVVWSITWKSLHILMMQSLWIL